MKKYLSSYPHLVKEWHPTKNGDLTPENFTHGSKKKVWWLCSKGHEYIAMPNTKTSMKSGCPYCSGAKASKDNNLFIRFPKIAKEWHPTKNGDLTPKDFTYGSKYKAWWVCKKGHNYQTSIGERTRKKPTGCPYCDGKKTSEENSLLNKFPMIAKEWHPTKNKKLTPRNITKSSDKKVWWLCSNNHTFQAVVKNRTQKKSKCPFCAGKKASEENNFQKLFPKIAKEWHPSKNKELKPENFTHGSKKKVWWLCTKKHSYQATINSRTNQSGKTGCPHCTHQSSEPEIRILSELMCLFKNVNSRYKIDNKEIDIFLSDYKIAIEFDGSYWHRNKENKDLEKNSVLKSHDIYLIRVRQFPLKPLNKNDIQVGKATIVKKDLDEILKQCIPFVDKNIKEKINNYFNQTSFVNEDLYNKYKSYLPSPFLEKSLLKTHPEICDEWDFDKNYPLKPDNFSYGAGHKAWWLCPKGHSYEAFIFDRLRVKLKCPYCLGKKTLNHDLFE
ncbi:MAG: hypothetical protein CBD69_010915 [Crocinitomicaceae bacterium TMED209]|nr:MAG: hypothetical protein CBD69_010915 [Crocinitomicaceae bacterium TMED209]